MNMNRMSIFCIITLALLLPGCKTNNAKNNGSTTNASSNVQAENTNASAATSDGEESETGTAYKITSGSYEYKDKSTNISLKYPQIQGMDNDIQSNWNGFIQGHSLTSDNDLDEYSMNCTIEEDFEIKTQNNELISILVDGYIYSNGAAHPGDYKTSYNIDLTNGDSKRLVNTGKISEYANRILNGDYSLRDESTREYVEEHIKTTYPNAGELEKELNDYDYDLSNPDFSPLGYSYYDNGKLVIVMTAPHALGDNIELIME